MFIVNQILDGAKNGYISVVLIQLVKTVSCHIIQGSVGFVLFNDTWSQ